MPAWLKHNLFKLVWEKLGIAQLSTREQWLVWGGVIFIVGFMVLQLAIIPFFEARGKLQKSITRKEQELVTIKELRQDFQTLKGAEGTIKERVMQRPSGFTLFTFLDQQAEKAKVKKQINYMKPSKAEGDANFNETMVEMKLQQISLEALVEYLRLVESEKNVVFIRRVSIQESGNEKGYLDAILQIVTFEKKE
jgi:general secretion pathway protein M